MSLKIPQHLGFIMDGNRRWAQERNLPTLEGHRKGYDTFKKVSDWCLDKGVKVMTFWAFSTENWSRPKREVHYLLKLLKLALRREVETLYRKNIRLGVLGQIEKFPQELQKEIRVAVEKTKKNTAGILNLALSYGGRAEIIDAVKKIISKGLKPAEITEAVVTQSMYAPALPDPDYIIRTSGEKRTSGFLLWESAYSELYFCKKYWPDFSKGDLEQALDEYQKRQRRFGG